MLTYNKGYKLKRKDRPWLLFVLAFIWVLGTVFFHSPWEPYEPFVFAVVKGILRNNSWLVPYISNTPYLEIQPFYFWIYAVVIKACGITNVTYMANMIRIINTLIVFGVLIIVGRIGSLLSAYKSGRTVILILISSLGFINIAYQLSPQILILLGFSLYIYALTKHKELPGISGWMLFLGLLFVSISFSCEFILIAVLSLIILPTIDSYWRNRRFFVSIVIGLCLFTIIFSFYCIQLHEVDPEFFREWQSRYTMLFYRNNYNFWFQSATTLKFLLWYIAPGWLLIIWSVIRRKKTIFKDKIVQTSIVLSSLLFIFTCISGDNPENSIFPIVIPSALLATIEVDSIRISIVSLINSFSIILFGLVGLLLWVVYIMLEVGLINNGFIHLLLSYTQHYRYSFSIWQVLLAIVISVIWLIMITRRHIRGREMVTNWASGSTFVVVLFLTLWLPWFDSVLTFKPMVQESMKYINRNSCLGTNSPHSTQMALWYYYENISLVPAFLNLNYSVCNQAIVATANIKDIDFKQWRIIWHARRPIDQKTYYLVKHR